MAATYDRNTALVVVDVQNDFADPAGSLPVRGAVAVIQAVNHEVEAAGAAGAPVVYTQDWHPPHTPHFIPDGGIWPVHCVRDTWGAEFHPGVTVAGPSVRKGTGGEDGYSGFTMRDPVSGEEASTGLQELLHEYEVDTLVVVGLALDYCVKATALDAVALGYQTIVPRGATAPVDVEPGDGERALEEMRAAGARLATADELVADQHQAGGLPAGS
jgi:nicotinamidase/pyrazinamidase